MGGQREAVDRGIRRQGICSVETEFTRIQNSHTPVSHIPVLDVHNSKAELLQS